MNSQAYTEKMAGVNSNGAPFDGDTYPLERDLERDKAVDAQVDGEHAARNGAPGPDAAPTKSLEELIEERRFNPALNPPPLQPVYTLNGIPICTKGNLTTITAAAKAGKTAEVGAMIAAVIKSPVEVCDTLGFESRNPEGKAVLHFDTEQSIDDHWHVVDRAMRRGCASELPPWFLSYCFTGFDARKACQAVFVASEAAAVKFGGVHSILIDGYADLVADVNDAAESNGFVSRMHDFAIHLVCPITGILHLNPGTEKSRGHLGSQLERKSETNLRLEKEGIYTQVWSDKQRRAPILKGQGPRFRWDDERGMHVSVESAQEQVVDEKTEAARNTVEDIFHDRPSMQYCDLVTTVLERLKCKPRWAEKKIAEWRKLGVVKKSVAGLWIPVL